MEDSGVIMADYDDPINIYEFKYRKPVYFTNPFSTYQTDLVVKLVLTAENFNFDLANDDGSDFRLLEYRTGIGVLKMWNAYWSKTNKYAVLFFKVPDIGGGVSVTFNAYWGNTTATGISDPDSMNFLFYETFPGSTIPTSKWSGNTSAGSSSYGYLFPSQSSFTTITNPLENKTSWVIEAGVYANFPATGWDAGDRAIGFAFEGTENDCTINVMHVDRIEHNATVNGGGTYSYMIKTYGGLEPYSYQEVHVNYYEPDDEFTVKLSDRNVYTDVEHEIHRKVEGDTRPKNIKLWGRQASSGADGAYPTYISWFVVREYDDVPITQLDGRDLYIEYENVVHQNQDYREYSPDLTDTQYQHETSFGGDPYALSDEGYDADTNVWVSNDDATLESEVALTIHTGWTSDMTSRGFIHYDSGHIYFYNASKLSDGDTDNMSRNYWHGTTTSGWAAIKFSDSETVGAFRMMPTSNLNACPKNFTFYGANFNPTHYFDRASKLYEGTFGQTQEWQSRVMTNNSNYKYYILDIQDTYGDENIEIQEWEMMPYLGQVEKRYVSQLRLHPALYDNWEYNFPKEISFLGSEDGITWTTLMPWTSTYTPFIEHYKDYGYWQRYSFNNTIGFWSFRLLCRGNWGASDNKIIIGEWSMHELAAEEYTYRILDGATNNIQQIWASANTGIDDERAVIYAANEKMNMISGNKLSASEDLPGYYEDFNVI